MDIINILENSTREISKAGGATAELDARVLLEYALKKSQEYLTAHSYEPLTNSDYARFRRAVRRRKKGEPIAYITKEKEFYGYDFYINKNVLVPRPESEMLVENALQFLESRITNYELRKRKELPTTDYLLPTILDVGTGSGCLIISLVKEICKSAMRHSPYAIRYFASDISKKALYVAKKNAKHHKINKSIRFFHSDLFSNPKMPKKYDLIIANLPYVALPSEKLKVKSEKLWKNSISYEPANSIFAKDNGTKVIKEFIEQAKTRINNDGLILIEADPRNIENISIYAKKQLESSRISIIKDLAGRKRVLKILT